MKKWLLDEYEVKHTHTHTKHAECTPEREHTIAHMHRGSQTLKTKKYLLIPPNLK